MHYAENVTPSATPPSTEEAYRQLVTEFCEQVGLDPSLVDTVASGGLVKIDGVNFSILLNTLHASAPALSIYVDMGAPPAQAEAAVLRMLLQQNFHSSAQRGPSFCISSVTGHVLCVSHYAVQGMTAQAMNEAVQQLIDRAIEWGDTYFLWAPIVRPVPEQWADSTLPAETAAS